MGSEPVGVLGKDRPYREGVIDGRRNFGGASLRQYALDPKMLGMIADRAGVRVPPPEDPFIYKDEEYGVMAEIYHDCLVARCPTLGADDRPCGGASFLWADSGLFMCADCFNSATDGLWRRAAIPEYIADVVEILGYRKLPNERNWNPTETVEDLLKENMEHGDAIPQRLRGRAEPGGRMEKAKE